MGQLYDEIRWGLSEAMKPDFPGAVRDLLGILGYKSDRTLSLSGEVEDFVREFPGRRVDTKAERAFLRDVAGVWVVFQMSNEELAGVWSACKLGWGFPIREEGRWRSVLFLAVELKETRKVRGVFDEYTREIDKRIAVPCLVFFRAGGRLTVAVVGRRPHKLDGGRDVLEPGTSLIRDISLQRANDGDVESLAELSLRECATWLRCNGAEASWDGILKAWLAKMRDRELSVEYYEYFLTLFQKGILDKRLPEGEESVLRRYSYEVARSTPLAREREVELAGRIARGDLRARNELVVANLRFVIDVAREYVNRGLPLSDVIGAGNAGLIRAAERFDGGRGCKFVTYAVWWIRQSILVALAEDVHVVRLPANKIGLLREISKALSRHGVDCGGQELVDGMEEIASDFELAAGEISALINARDTLYFQDHLPEREGGIRANAIVDEATPGPDVAVLRGSARRRMEADMGVLKWREREVLRLYFGLWGEEAHTLEEIGVGMNLTRERVRQIRNGALKRLRRRMSYEALETLATLPATVEEVE